MSEQNGKSKIIMGLIGVLQLIVMAFALWAGSNIVDAKTKLASVETSITGLQTSMTDMKDEMRDFNKKLDKIRGR